MKINVVFVILSTLNLSKYLDWKFNTFSNSAFKNCIALVELEGIKLQGRIQFYLKKQTL